MFLLGLLFMFLFAMMVVFFAVRISNFRVFIVENRSFVGNGAPCVAAVLGVGVGVYLSKNSSRPVCDMPSVVLWIGK